MEEEKKEYKNKVLFARLSKKGNHVYMFERDGILGKDVESLLINVVELKELLAGNYESIKVSAMDKKEEEAEG